jgi:Predicted nucleoside-diphosphate-sugar epimerases
MKYVITGSLGHISRPVVAALTAQGHEVTVITSQQDRAADITALGAQAAVGSVTDEQFIAATFKDADAVYLMIPPNYVVADFPAYQKAVADNYVKALAASKAQHVVLLSSIGAHMRQGAGPIDALGYLEEQLETLQGRHITILRPAYFLYNLLGMASMLKNAGIVGSNFGSDTEKVAMVHHLDIANRVIHHLTNAAPASHSIEYIVSDERYTADIANVLAKAVGREGAPWITFTDEQAYEAMTQQGLTPSLAGLYVAMGKAFREGRAQEHYWQQRKELTSQRKLEDFAQEFAKVYNTIPEPAAQA